MAEQRFNSIWDALEDDPVKRENLRLRSELMMAIDDHIKAHKLTQKKAATLLKTTQPRVSAIKQGKIDDFRLDMLIDFAHRLGLHVSLKVAA